MKTHGLHNAAIYLWFCVLEKLRAQRDENEEDHCSFIHNGKPEAIPSAEQWVEKMQTRRVGVKAPYTQRVSTRRRA